VSWAILAAAAVLHALYRALYGDGSLGTLILLVGKINQFERI
jgi:hypothetical protein